jgi:hypothetical protein
MKMARAFMAAIPLAVALVAAVIVPLTLIPGTFGFHGWPSASGGHVVATQVDVAPDLPVARGGRVQPSREGERDTVASTRGARSAPRTLAAAPASGRGPAGSAETALPTRAHGSGPGDGTSTPAPAPSTPAVPATGQGPPAAGSEPAQPPTEVAVGGDAPVLRDEPSDALAPPAAPPIVDVPAPAPRDNGSPRQHQVVGFVVGL